MNYCSNCKYSTERFPRCSECGYGMKYILWEPKEESSMKLIYKSPMTEEEQKEEFNQLIITAMDSSTYAIRTELTNRAMDICRNDTKEVEGVEIPLILSDWVKGSKKLTIPEMKEIAELYNSIQDPQGR